jgi:putative ABC transport system substrate-binding protein
MRRREFIGLLSAAAVCPGAARAQQAATPVIGFLNSSSPGRFAPYTAAFLQGLREAGFVEGRNVVIEYRWADDREERIPALAADLVQRQVQVIAGVNTAASVRAAKGVTSTVPIVFSIGGDPVRLGLVASFNRPGENVTGVSYLSNGLGPKRIELLRELAPHASVFAVLVNPRNPNAEADFKEVQSAVATHGRQTVAIEVGSDHNLEDTFAHLVQQRVGAFLIAPDPLFLRLRPQILALAARHKLPAMFNAREWVEAGGLMSYGPSMADSYRQNGIYTGRILKGEVPAEIPVLQPTDFEFVVNSKASKALGLDIPQTLFALADEVIE